MSPSSMPRSGRQALVWSGLLLAALAVALVWWFAGRPVALPDAPSARIACVSYAPFRRAGETPLDPHAFISRQRIDADMQVLSQRFDCVRTYSQGQGLSAVPDIAARHGMKVLMGIWLGSDPAANAQQVRLGIAAARKSAGALRGIIVGNEVLLRGELSPSALSGYVRQVRNAVDVPVSYADVWEFWLRYPQLASSVDFITVHILPYWEDRPVAPEHAVRHVADVYARVKRAFPGRSVMIGETGWPSAGRTREHAAASVVNEARYLRSFLRYAATVSMPYNVIEAFDQPWKRAQEGTVGGYWGIFDVQGRPKFPMQGPVVENPRWWLGEFAAGAGALLFLLVGGWRRRWRGWLALGLSGWASGGALAWQARQMSYACGDAWEWVLSGAACIAALVTALWLARWMAARLDGEVRPDLRMIPVRFGWLFALAFYDLLLVFDGRYRDFPLGLFALPCAGFALAGWLGQRRPVPPLLESRFLAMTLLVLGVTVVVQERGVNPTSWLWLGLNVLLAVSVLGGWRRVWRQGELATHEA